MSDPRNKQSVPKTLGRRGAVLGIGAAATAAALPGAAAKADDPPPAQRVPDRTQLPDNEAAHRLATPADDVAALFGPLSAGSSVGDVRIETVYAVRAGAIPVILSTGAGARFAVEIFRAQSPGTNAGTNAAGPVASEEQLAFYVSNRGDGRRATDEVAGLGTMALARELGNRIRAGAEIPEALTTHAERRRREPNGVFHVPI